MKKIMAVLAAGVVFIALAMTSCSDRIAEEEGPTVTLYFGGSSRSADDHAVYPYTPVGGDGSFHSKITYEIKFYEKETDIGPDHGGKEPACNETASGGTDVSVKLKKHGTYNVYVNAFLGFDPYAELNEARDNVVITGSGIRHLEIDTTKTTSLTVPISIRILGMIFSLTEKLKSEKLPFHSMRQL